MLKLGFIGAGTVGTALSVRLSSKGYQVIAVSSRSQISARKLARAVNDCHAFNNNQDVADTAELIFITTPDDTTASVVSEIQWHTGQSVVHCSGALSTDILESAKKLGAQVGAFHPLQTFARSFPRSYDSGAVFKHPNFLNRDYRGPAGNLFCGTVSSFPPISAPHRNLLAPSYPEVKQKSINSGIGLPT